MKFCRYIKKLQDDVKGKSTTDPKTDEEKLKAMGLKTTSNIQILIRDLYHPSFKSKIQLSWVSESSKKERVTAADSTEKTTSNKRPITFSSGNNEPPRGPKQRKTASGQKVYTPPSGKFSSRLNQHQQSNFKSNPNRNKFRRGGGGGGGGGGGRGRGAAGGGRNQRY
jgi:hypothetical protein